MLQLLDRVSLAVSDVNAAIECCEDIFGSLVVDEIFDRECCARRVSMQLGESLLELMEPRGPGPVLDFIDQHKEGAFAIGLAVTDPAKFADSLAAKGILVYTQTPRRFLVFPDDCRGCGFIVTRVKDRSIAGLVTGINRIVLTVPNLVEAVTYFSNLLDIDIHQVKFSAAEGDPVNRAIVWLDQRSAMPASGIEWISSGSGPLALDQPTASIGLGICEVAVTTNRLLELCDRAVKQGYDWTDNGAGGMLCLPALNNLHINVIVAGIPDSRAMHA